MLGNNLFILVLVSLVTFLLGIILGKLLYEKYVSKEKSKLEKQIQDSESKATEIVNKAEEKAKKIEDDANKEYNKKMEKIENFENKIFQKEENLDNKLEKLEQQKEELSNKRKEVDDIIKKEEEELSRIGNLSVEEAKSKIFQITEERNKQELSDFIAKYTNIKKEESKNEASGLLAKVLPRAGMNEVSNFTVSIVDLPSEDTKGKIIGREGRNIAYFEKLTGVEIIIDDTPYVVKLSSFDPEKRYIATEVLNRLIKDGRINPYYIEQTFNEVNNNFDDLMLEKGKDALFELNLPMMNPEVVKMIGQYYLRYSYGQNLWIHSIEVARISELLANELGFDGVHAKKAGLLHDVGKLKAGNGEAHANLGGEILRKYGYDDVIVNSAESHHFDVQMIHPISWIVTAADAISASRPGARFNTKELFLERMTNLEQLISSVEGVEKVHIMQAGREIYVFVNPEEIGDLDIQNTIQDIGKKVEDQLDYPGAIRVVAIREQKVVDYLR